MNTAPLPEACARAAERAGGTLADVEDLLWVWRRVAADTEGRAAAIRSQDARRYCGCADGGVGSGDGRCGRCYGRLRGER